MNQAYVAVTQHLEETQEMCRLAIGFLKMAPLLELYAKVVYGEPGMN